MHKCGYCGADTIIVDADSCGKCYDDPARLMRGVEKTQWISVKDRLPDDGGYVLVSDGEDVYMGYKDNSMAFEYMEVEAGSMIAFADITHWQPMPAPPGSKDDE